MTFTLTSPDFASHGEIPARFTCEGNDVSPRLEWSGAPAGTRSFALLVDDPDAPDPKAPKRTWVHWVIFYLPATVAALPQGATGAIADGAREGLNDWNRKGYGGPCPPIGRHRYFFNLYALDTTLNALDSPRKADLEQAMIGHILAKAELIGTYQKGHK